MIKIVNSLPISEEMLGAYLEGNLSVSDAMKIESVLENDSNFSKFVSEITLNEEIEKSSIFDDQLYFGNNFELPKVSSVLDISEIPLTNDILQESYATNVLFPLTIAHSFCSADCVIADSASIDNLPSEDNLVDNDDEFKEGDCDNYIADDSDLLINSEFEGDFL